MICMKSANSRLFEEAFFVLREEGAAVDERDMLTEANRILEEHLLPARRTRRADWRARRLGLLLSFLAGALFAGSISLLLVWLLLG
jgi:hypothetical protein